MRACQNSSMQADNHADRRGRRLRWRVPLAALGLLIASVVIDVARSSPNPIPRAPQGSPAVVGDADLQSIREAVVRYQVEHLVPNDLSQAAAAKLAGYCIGFDRTGVVDPSAEMLRALKNLPLSVMPYSGCVKEGMKGRVPLWVISVASSGPDGVQAIGRSGQNSYVYALERRQSVWVVTAAKLTGRS